MENTAVLAVGEGSVAEPYWNKALDLLARAVIWQAAMDARTVKRGKVEECQEEAQVDDDEGVHLLRRQAFVAGDVGPQLARLGQTGHRDPDGAWRFTARE